MTSNTSAAASADEVQSPAVVLHQQPINTLPASIDMESSLAKLRNRL
jgi:hypothetical protein